MVKALLKGVEVTQGTIVTLTVTAIFLFILPVIWTLVWKRRCGSKVSFAPLFIGAAGFLVSVQVLELGVHMVCIMADNPVSRFINGSTPAYVLYGIFMAGIFEECGRYVVIRFIMKRNKNRENMVMYGIGHGGIEVWAISLLSVINSLLIAVMIKTIGMDNALQFFGVAGNIPMETAKSAAASIASVAGFDLAAGAVCVFERICSMVFHISLTVMVAYGIMHNKKKYLGLAILVHAASDVSAALFQRGVIPIWAAEIWIFICSVLIAIWSIKLYGKMETA